MNFVRRPESKRAPPPPEISEKYKSLDAKLLRMKKKNRWKWGIHLCERREESGERRAVVGERKIDYLVVIFLEKEPLKPWKSGRLASKFRLKLTKKTPKPWNMPSKIVK